MTACSFSSPVSWIEPHKIDVRQGNWVDQRMAEQLQKGMTRDQVRFVLGTPLTPDVFNANRWDYVYRMQSGQGEVEQRVLSVYFDNDRVSRVEGDVKAVDPAATDKRVVEILAEPANRP